MIKKIFFAYLSVLNDSCDISFNFNTEKQNEKKTGEEENVKRLQTTR